MAPDCLADGRSAARGGILPWNSTAKPTYQTASAAKHPAMPPASNPPGRATTRPTDKAMQDSA